MNATASGLPMGHARRLRVLPVLASFALTCVLTACDRVGLGTPAATSTPAPVTSVNPEVSWASAALSRNPTIEVLATDPSAGVFTVRIKATGEVRAVRLSELAASPIAELVNPTQVAARMAASEPAAPVAQAAANIPAADPEPVAQSTAPTPASNTDPVKNYTIERAGGQLKVSGPGVSIVSSGPAAASGNSTAAERSTGPVICEGNRRLHLDNRVINASGDAVIARGGCELYITNSRIAAGGTAVIVANATVYIANSTIEGAMASFDADSRAKMFVRSSTFKGVPRRAEAATFQDQGGNQWR